MEQYHGKVFSVFLGLKEVPFSSSASQLLKMYVVAPVCSDAGIL